MSQKNFNQQPDDARLWIFGIKRNLTTSEVEQFTDFMNRFMANWTAHKREMVTGWELKYDQFIFVGVDESRMAASGCSIDSLVRALQEFEQEIGTDIVNTGADVFYRHGDDIRCIARHDFKRLVADGFANEETVVFNNTLLTVGELRRGRWEVPMRESWHQQAFGLPV